MNKKLITTCVFICAVFVIMVAAAGCSLTDNTMDESGKETEEFEGNTSGGALSEGDEAPDFTAELVGGGTFTLSDHKDDVVLINFWATWCGYCVDEMPEIDKLNKENLDGVEIVLVDCMETKAEVDDFIKDAGYTFDIAYDEDGSIENKYPTTGIPYTVVIKDGVIRKTFLGVPNDPYNTYKSTIEECLK